MTRSSSLARNIFESWHLVGESCPCLVVWESRSSASLYVQNMYIYHLPHIEKTDLCRILDLEGKWQELGAVHMKFDQFTMQVSFIFFIIFSPVYL